MTKNIIDWQGNEGGICKTCMLHGNLGSELIVTGQPASGADFCFSLFLLFGSCS